MSDRASAGHCSELASRDAVTPVDARPDAHELLLELAGRLDDDLLAWARELVAVGEEGQAVELVSAALAAERVALPPAVRAAVVAAGRAAHTDLDVERGAGPGRPPTTRRGTGSTPGPGRATGSRAVLAAPAGAPARRVHAAPDLAADARGRRARTGAAGGGAGRDRPGPFGGRAGLPARDRAGPGRRAGVGRGVHDGRRPARVPRRGAAVRAADRGRGLGHRAGRGGRRPDGGGGAAARRGAARVGRPEPADARTDTAALLVMPSGGDAAGPPGEAGARAAAKREPAAVTGARGRDAAWRRLRGRPTGSGHRPVPRPAAGSPAGAAARSDDAGCRRRRRRRRSRRRSVPCRRSPRSDEPRRGAPQPVESEVDARIRRSNRRTRPGPSPP